MQTSELRIALLHLAPRVGELDHNRRLIEKAIEQAAANGAEWLITPELAVCGYSFNQLIGTDWIMVQPDGWLETLCRKTEQLGITLFLGHPERDPTRNKLYNSVLLIDGGAIVGRHRKINVLRSGSEAWSSPGTEATPFSLPRACKVGLLICSDAFSPDIAASLKAQGAQLLVSPASWAPGFHGPNGEWELCSSVTGLPLLVCNRTGPDLTLDFRNAESLIARNGKRLLSFRSPQSTVILVNWNLQTHTLADDAHRMIPL